MKDSSGRIIVLGLRIVMLFFGATAILGPIGFVAAIVIVVLVIANEA